MRSVAIIGAGPIGCFSGELLAKKGFDVHIFEEHESIGRPVQCTGIVTSGIMDIVPIPAHCIRNHAKAADIYSPQGKAVHIRFRRPDIILDREAFDRWMGGRASMAGATIHTRHRFTGLKGDACVFEHKGKTIEKKFTLLIGADGPLSQVAQAAGFKGKRNYLQGIQAIAAMKNDGTVRFFPHFGTIGWVVPEDSETVRIGVMARSEAKKEFISLVTSQLGERPVIQEMQGGIIPEYSPALKTQNRGKVFLVGDAAGQVKATTGGGIIPGLIAAKALAQAIATGKDYERLWKKEIGRSLTLHLLMRNTLDRMCVDDYESMVKLFRKKSLREALGEVDRDDPLRLLVKCLFAEPRVLGLMRHLF